MPAPLGPLVGLALGALFAWFASDGANRGKASLTVAPLALVALFALLVFTPVAGYFIAFAPDWSYAYLIDASRRLGALHIIVLLADIASVPIGFAFALRGVRTTFSPVLVRLLGLPLLGASVFVAVFLPRLSVEATYAQFHGDFGTRPAAGGPLGYALIWSTLILAAGATWTAHSLKRLR